MAVPIIVPRRREDFFEPNGEPTLRFVRWMESVTDSDNASNISIETLEENQAILEAKAITQASIFNQQSQHDSAGNRIETLEVKPSVSHADLFNISQQLDGPNDRIEAIEVDLATRPRMTDIFKTNQRIDELIDELIAEIRAIAPNTELEHKAHCVQVETLQQLKLLNMRTEESLETDLDETDL